MVTLAERFAALNQAPPEDPTLENPPELPRTGNTSAAFAMPPGSPPPRSPEPGIRMQSPGSCCAAVPPVAPTNSAADTSLAR
jgi:hypothetical protein